MADNEIKLVSEAVKTLSAELKKLELDLVRGDKTVTEYTTAVLAARDAFATTKASADALVPGMLKVEAAMGKAAGAARGGIVSAIQGMEIQINKTRPLVTSFSQAIQDSGQFSMGAAQGIRSVANNVEMMAQQFAYLKSQGMSTKEILSQMAMALRGPMGFLLAVSATGMAMEILSQALSKSNKEAKEFKDLTLDIIGKLHQLKRVTDDQIISYYKLLIAQLEFQNKQTKTMTVGVPIPTIYGNIPMPVRVEGLALGEKEREENRNKILDYEVKIQGVQEKQTKELEKQNKESMEFFLHSIHMANLYRDMAAGGVMSGSVNVPATKGFAAGLMPYTFFDTKGLFSGNAAQAIPRLVYPESKFKPESGGKMGAYKSFGDYAGALISEENQKDAEEKSKQLTNTLKHGFREASSVLLDGFQKSLGFADNLGGKLEAMAVMFGAKMALAFGISQIPGVGTFASVLNIIGLAGGGYITEPVIGRGMRSGNIYTLAEHGPEYVSPESSNRMGQQGRYGASMMQQMIKVVPIVDNRGLAVQVEIGTAENGRVRL